MSRLRFTSVSMNWPAACGLRKQLLKLFTDAFKLGKAFTPWQRPRLVPRAIDNDDEEGGPRDQAERDAGFEGDGAGEQRAHQTPAKSVIS
jgi:hypothetical protein